MKAVASIALAVALISIAHVGRSIASAIPDETACQENRTMKDIMQGNGDADGFFTGGLGGMAAGPYRTYGCWRRHPCLEAAGIPPLGEEAVCFKYNSELQSWAWLGLQSELGLQCAGPMLNTSSSSSNSSSSSGTERTVYPGTGCPLSPHYTSLSGTNLARQCGSNTKRYAPGCATSWSTDRVFGDWSGARAVDGELGTWAMFGVGKNVWGAGGIYPDPAMEPWMGINLGTEGNEVTGVRIKVAGWVRDDGSWKENYPVSIYVGDSRDWTQNCPCVLDVTNFSHPQASLVGAVSGSINHVVGFSDVLTAPNSESILPNSTVDFFCPTGTVGRNVHIVVGGINTLMMGEMEVYGRRTATYSADRWEGCSRGSYRYDGVCVECPVGWTTPTAPVSLPANTGPESWTGCILPCSSTMLADSTTGCRGAWYKGKSWPETSTNGVWSCNKICGDAGKTCQSGGMDYAWTWERFDKVLALFGGVACQRYRHENDPTMFPSIDTCGGCGTGSCYPGSKPGNVDDDGTGNPSLFNYTDVESVQCTWAGNFNRRRYCSCA